MQNRLSRGQSGWMFSDPFTCQGWAYTGGPIQRHRDGRNTAGQETRTVTFSQQQWNKQAEQNKDLKRFQFLIICIRNSSGTRSRQQNKTCLGINCQCLFTFTSSWKDWPSSDWVVNDWQFLRLINNNNLSLTVYSATPNILLNMHAIVQPSRKRN